MPEALIYRNEGRNRRTVGALVAAVLILYALHSIGTMTWVLVLLGIFAVPALIDVIMNPVATFELTDEVLRWKSALQRGEVGMDQVRSARFDTRLDVSIRVTLTLVDGSTLRIPQDALPPAKSLESALRERGVDVERHHFRVI